MKRSATALVAALILTIPISLTRDAAADGSFPEVPIVTPPPRSVTWSYVALAGGVGSIAASFVFAGRGNAAYEDYLEESDPDQIERLWNRATLNDRLSSGLLLGGEALLGAAIYLAFLREPPATDPGPMSAAPARRAVPLALSVRPGRCALSWRF